MTEKPEKHLGFIKTSSKLIYNSFRKILKKEFILPNGSTHEFEIMHINHKIAIVVAFDEKGNLILVKQYRPGPEKILIELPGGKVEDGEEAIDGARRELLEETGYITDDIKEVGSYYSGAYSDGIFTVFIAKNCVKYSEQELDQTEFIEHLIWSTSEFEAYFKSEPTNGQCLLAYFLAKPYF